MIFFTADEHFGHANIIKYCNRPFSNVEEMDEMIIAAHNRLVNNDDVVYHLGDFTLKRRSKAQQIIERLNGKQHIFIRGSHDRWLDDTAQHIFAQENAQRIIETKIEGQIIVLCHYSMRVWHKSHYNSWQLFGHSHGLLKPIGKQWDVGVDNNNFEPVSFEKLKKIMAKRPDNFNFIHKNKTFRA